MYVILWEFEIRPEKRNAFIAAYNKDGAGAQLFRQAEGYLSTDLLCSIDAPEHYITIDRWHSSESFTRFQADFAETYRALDAFCESLAVAEKKLGAYTSAI